MVTLLESGLFAQFNAVFVFLFVLVAVYAVLSQFKVLGEHKGINATIAFVFAILFASSKSAMSPHASAAVELRFLYSASDTFDRVKNPTKLKINVIVISSSDITTADIRAI